MPCSNSAFSSQVSYDFFRQEHHSSVAFASTACNAIFTFVPSGACTNHAATAPLPRFNMAEEEEIRRRSISAINNGGLHNSKPGRAILSGKGPRGRIFIRRRKGHLYLAESCECTSSERSMPGRHPPSQHNERPICSNGAMARWREGHKTLEHAPTATSLDTTSKLFALYAMVERHDRG